jgi:hypothetical protein
MCAAASTAPVVIPSRKPALQSRGSNSSTPART